MRTTVTVDEALVRDLVELTGARSKSAAVRRALVEQIRVERLRRLAGMLGSVSFDESTLGSAEAADLARAARVRGGET